ncbi:MAG: pseudouridine synthase [Flavobacteriales bacterium]|nr:MAG: pseudouridine synthase [Flavobacteriales bacterium]
MEVVLSLMVIVLSCLIIWKASNGFEMASEYLGRNLSQGVRGATINAIGSSIPELFTTIFFLLILHDQEGFSGGIGTTAGSAIFNAMVIPAIVILTVIAVGKVKFVQVSKKVVLRDGIMLLISEVALIYLLASGVLYWWHGLILMLMYGVYVVVMFSTMKKNISEEENNEEEEETSNTEYGFWGNCIRLNLEQLIIGNRPITNSKAWLLLLVSTLVVGMASAFLVLACEHFGNVLDIPIYFVAVILAAAATSVPDTILSIKDAQKGNYDDAVSNALGSNIFDICFALGFPLFMYALIFNPIEINGMVLENTNELRILLLILTVVVFFIFLFSKKMKAIQSIMLLLVYIFFVIFILGKSTSMAWVEEVSSLLKGLSQYF